MYKRQRTGRPPRREEMGESPKRKTSSRVFDLGIEYLAGAYTDLCDVLQSKLVLFAGRYFDCDDLVFHRDRFQRYVFFPRSTKFKERSPVCKMPVRGISQERMMTVQEALCIV